MTLDIESAKIFYAAQNMLDTGAASVVGQGDATRRVQRQKRDSGQDAGSAYHVTEDGCQATRCRFWGAAVNVWRLAGLVRRFQQLQV